MSQKDTARLMTYAYAYRRWIASILAVTPWVLIVMFPTQQKIKPPEQETYLLSVNIQNAAPPAPASHAALSMPPSPMPAPIPVHIAPLVSDSTSTVPAVAESTSMPNPIPDSQSNVERPEEVLADTPQVRSHDPASLYVEGVQSQFGHTGRFKVITDGAPSDPSTPQAALRVVIGFDLNRDGMLISKSIVQSSGDAQVDHDALNSLNRTAFASFPPDVWATETDHHFEVTLELIKS
ncbi:energy transducer TonB [Aquirhabdus parva]|uniref:Energy transducer TonB n=2 Tax=Aquirhabdus parva TaxID=2283318 RepID=A0A345P924_9GAMM|nr:energy transducer TonB [Aquirhabdus parva]